MDLLRRLLSTSSGKLFLALIAAVAFVAGVLAVPVAIETGGGHRAAAPTVTARVDGADRDRKRDDQVVVPRSLVDQTARALEYGPGKSNPRAFAGTPRQRADVVRAENHIRRTERPLPTAGASQGFPGCVTRFVVNQSSRHGVRPSQFWVHYTASPNRPGWGDVNAIVALFDRPSFSASSHFVIDNEGHCAYIVPIENKAWTQAGANAFGINVEYINSGSEGRYCAPAGCAKLTQVALEVQHRTGIPVGRLGAVSNCTPTRSGTVTHWMGGPCSGGHIDIKPYSITAVVAMFARGAPKPILTPLEAKIIKGAARPKGTGHSRRYWCGRESHQIAAIRAAAHRPGGGGYKARHRGAREQRLRKSHAKRCG